MSPTRTTRKKVRRKAARAAATKPSRRTAARSGPSRSAPRRADFGAPVEAFLARQPPHLREILDALRAIVAEAAPDAVASLKWGMPWFTIGGELACGLGAHRAHVNLILPGPPGTYADPAGRLGGEATTGKHLGLAALAELPRADVRRWIRTAAARARAKAGRGS